MLQPLDGPSKSFKLSSVGVTTPVEVFATGSAFPERKVITLQSDGKFYIYFADEGEVPNAATVSANGFIQYKNAKESYEASGSQAVFVLAVTGTVDIRGTERA
jgi:hypothetical protein|tara:strand:- start:1022 stop:1330 length:309 start_codon:yes stop_codon:yes gene_type:complete